MEHTNPHDLGLVALVGRDPHDTCHGAGGRAGPERERLTGSIGDGAAADPDAVHGTDLIRCGSKWDRTAGDDDTDCRRRIADRDVDRLDLGERVRPGGAGPRAGESNPPDGMARGSDTVNRDASVAVALRGGPGLAASR